MLGVALFLLESLCLQERYRIDGLLDRLREAREKGCVACQQPRLEQGSFDGDVGPCRLDAGVDRAHAVGDLEADIPKHADEVLESLAIGGRRFAAEEDEDVDVGKRE